LKKKKGGPARRRSPLGFQLLYPGLYALQLGFKALGHLLQVGHLHLGRGSSWRVRPKPCPRPRRPEARLSQPEAKTSASTATPSCAKGPPIPRTVSHAPAGSRSISCRARSISTRHISFTSLYMQLAGEVHRRQMASSQGTRNRAARTRNKNPCLCLARCLFRRQRACQNLR
jgi:hypothetical protein